MADTKAAKYDAIILGSGQGGKPLAVELAGAGWNVALIEAKHLGGTCVNEGCTPTKTMVASARVAHLVHRAEDYGVKTGAVTVDLAVVRDRKRSIVETFRGGSEKLVEKTDNLDLYMGTGRFVSPHEIDVELNAGGTARLYGEKIVINTGARPSKPPIDGIEDVETLDSTSIMELDAVPRHLVVIGGSYIGLEFGQMFRRFGAQVTIIEYGPQLIVREDEDVAEAVKEIMQDDGIAVMLNASANRVERHSNGTVELSVEQEGMETTVSASHLLLAAGRTPNTDDIGIDKVGVELDKRGHIVVDDRLGTNVDHVFAIGDVKGGPAFTHISYDDFRILKSGFLGDGSRSIADRPVPYTMFIDPQLAKVGLSEKEAKQQGRKYTVARIPMTSVARALETDETRGLMKALIDPDTDQIIGCTILGIEGGEIMAVLQTAMMGGLPYTAIRDGVYAHPTLAESLNNLFARVEK
ncbi:FAD-containing oxidoreductase [candidate division GN15 bacterium]|nr:FAD-containing oxidoreductase [candidate division GN15 bacterium]